MNERDQKFSYGNTPNFGCFFCKTFIALNAQLQWSSSSFASYSVQWNEVFSPEDTYYPLPLPSSAISSHLLPCNSMHHSHIHVNRLFSESRRLSITARNRESRFKCNIFPLPFCWDALESGMEKFQVDGLLLMNWRWRRCNRSVYGIEII